jgi:putative transposase
VIHHSDQGSQYTSLAFGKRCEQAGVRPSMGSVGDCFDNALCETFFATLESELLNRESFKTQAEARAAVFEFIEGWYNPHSRHSALDYLSPIDYERRHAAGIHRPTSIYRTAAAGGGKNRKTTSSKRTVSGEASNQSPSPIPSTETG